VLLMIAQPQRPAQNQVNNKNYEKYHTFKSRTKGTRY
jgi:hypothetical protein